LVSEHPIQNVQHVRQAAGDDPRAEHHAALFALANGLVGIKGSLDELAALPDVILSSVHVTRPIAYHEAFPGYAATTETRVLCPSPAFLRIVIDGGEIDFANARIERFERWLDMDTGVLHRTTRWQLDNGREFDISTQRIVPLDGGALVASRLSFTAINFSGVVALVPAYGLGGKAAPVADGNDPRISARVSDGWTAATSPYYGVDRFTSGTLAVDYRSVVTPTIGQWQEDGAVRGSVEPGASLAFDRVVQIDTADAVSVTTPLPGFDAVAQQQQQSVTRFWERASCTVAGDDRLTQALRFNQFQLFQSASRDDRYGTAAKGMTGDGYEGHCFWDAEAFMLPALAFSAPDRARAMIGYRIGKLDAARANARQLGHRSGALYPWRTITGSECSSHYPTGAAQYHINADIAFALKFYVEVTGDEACLDDAAEMLFETARIWFQIGRFDPARGGAFCIYGITGPDEYTALVDNDFYTNAAARLHLDFAAHTATRLRQRDSARFAALAQRLELDDSEIATWARAAAAMWLPVDATRGINPQDDTFLSKPEFTDTLRVPGRPLLLDHHPMTLFRHQVCKQGDVIQAMAMGMVEMPLSRAIQNYDYYEPITSHDSTLSAPAFGIVAAAIGAYADARHFLDEAAFVDIEDRHHNTDHGLHMAALAGSWLALARGWAGLNIRDGQLYFAPRSAPELATYDLRLQWHDSVLAISVDPNGATYEVKRGPAITIYDHGRAFEIETSPVTILRPTTRAIIFDLDGVLTDTAEDHYHAWAELSRRHGFVFDKAFNENLKGVDRVNSLRLILINSGIDLPVDEFTACLAEKNALYQQRLAAYTPEHLFAGVHELFADCRSAGLRLALASASRNAPEVIERLGIADQFDFVADPGAVGMPKPAPDIFLACADALDISPEHCIGVEDAQAGIAAIRAAGMPAVGISDGGLLTDTHWMVPRFADLSLTDILKIAEHSKTD
jgi:beta-phosphoglucomutase